MIETAITIEDKRTIVLEKKEPKSLLVFMETRSAKQPEAIIITRKKNAGSASVMGSFNKVAIVREIMAIQKPVSKCWVIFFNGSPDIFKILTGECLEKH